MFVTFSSDAYDISYFETVAKRLLSLMGHSGMIPGAIKAAEVPQALARLQDGLAKQKEDHSYDDDEDGEGAEVTLAKRAVPLIGLLEAAAEKKSDVLWNHANSPS